MPDMVNAIEVLDMSTVDMNKVEMWSKPVVCFIATECIDGKSRCVNIESFDGFIGMDGTAGTYNLDDTEKLISIFPVPLGTKEWYGKCEGCIDDLVRLGCEIPGQTTFDFKTELVWRRSLMRVDIYTGEKVV